MKSHAYALADISAAEWAVVGAIVLLAIILLIRVLHRKPRGCDSTCANCALRNSCSSNNHRPRR